MHAHKRHVDPDYGICERFYRRMRRYSLFRKWPIFGTKNRPPAPFFFARWITSLVQNRLLDLRVEGRENVPEDSQFIIVANHLNWSDPFFIFDAFPPIPRVVFVSEYLNIYDTPWRRFKVDFFGRPLSPIRRDDPKSRLKTLRSMMEIIKDGNILAIFPEGRLGHKEGGLFPVNRGVFAIAKRYGIPVLPVGLAGSHRLYLRKPITIRIGRPVYSPPDESDEQYAERGARILHATIPPYPGDGPWPHRWEWMTYRHFTGLRAFEGNTDDWVLRDKPKSQDG